VVSCGTHIERNVQANIDEVYGCLKKSKLPFGPHKGELKPLEHYAFRDDPKEAKVFWDVRKGLIPIVGGARESGAMSALPLGLLITCWCHWPSSDMVSFLTQLV
jgi:D-lactate dehydrogenase